VKRLFRAAALILVAAAVLLVLFHTAILTAFGNFLVRDDPPAPSDMVVVLAGDGFGNRILKAAQLVKDGFAPHALISGPDGSYGNYECDLAIPFAVRAGYPESYFIHFENHARSTEEETQALAAKLREMGVKKVILVTSTYHTRRSGKLLRRAAPDLDVRVVAAPDKFFQPDSWWRNREARKIFLLEWTKTVAEW
jgi:uncharacterized SAM-binding protein YcdF (DUF218 family)